jgi:hypothetical protein
VSDDAPARVLTAREAAREAGLIERDANRVDRSTLPSVMGHDRIHRILRSELFRAGLLGFDGVLDPWYGATPLRQMPREAARWVAALAAVIER